MAVLLTESFDGYGGDATQMLRRWNTFGGTPTPLSSTHAKTGSYAYGTDSGGFRSIPISPATDTLIVGAWVYYTGAAPTFPVLGFLGYGTTYDGFNITAAVTVDTSSRVLVTNGNGGSTLATSAAALNSNAWNYIVAKITVANSGTYEVYVNGSQVLIGSGDTAGAFGGSQAVTAFGLGGATSLWTDSVWVLDTSGSTLNDFPAENLVVLCFLPTGDGAHAEFTPSTGTNHAALVDDAIANDDTDYNSGTDAQSDTYTFDFSTLSGRTRYASKLSMCVKAASAGTNRIAGVARAGGLDYVGASQSVTTSYAYYEDRRTA